MLINVQGVFLNLPESKRCSMPKCWHIKLESVLIEQLLLIPSLYITEAIYLVVAIKTFFRMTCVSSIWQ